MGIVIPVGFGLAQLVFQRDGAPRESITTFGYDPPTLDPVAHADTINALVRGVGRPITAAQMETGWSFVGVRCTEMDDVGPLQGEFLSLLAGTGAAGAMPPNCAVLIRKFTAAGGRRNRGRMFVPPVHPAETNVSPSGTIAGAQLTNLQTWWGNVLTQMGVAGLPVVLFHSEVPFTPTPVTSFVVQSVIATQRRRMRR